MKLTDLEPELLKAEDRKQMSFTDSLAEADGIMFLCPKCFKANGGSKGTHVIICWRPRAATEGMTPGPGRWDFRGTSLENLSLVARSSSIQVNGGCRAHFFVETGRIRLC